MIIVIEIGGTKLQLALGDPDTKSLDKVVQFKINPEKGAKGILELLHQQVSQWCIIYQIDMISIGFGGAVTNDGLVIRSNQIEGWEYFDLSRHKIQFV